MPPLIMIVVLFLCCSGEFNHMPPLIMIGVLVLFFS